MHIRIPGDFGKSLFNRTQRVFKFFNLVPPQTSLLLHPSTYSKISNFPDLAWSASAKLDSLIKEQFMIYA
jgi:hypothetical protein